MKKRRRPANPVPAAAARVSWRDIWRGDRVFLVAISCAFLALCGAHLAFSRAMPTFSVPIIDASEYLQSARALLGVRPPVWEAMGDLPTATRSFHSPFYTWFLAAVFAVFGQDLILVRVLQSFVAVAAGLVVYVLAHRLLGRSAARCAFVAWSVYGPLIFFTSEILNVSWALLLDVLALALVVEAWERPSGRAWLQAGLCAGLAATVRPDVLFFSLGVALVLAIVSPGNMRVGRAAAYTLGVGLPLLAAGAWNAGNQGAFHVLPLNSGLNFYVGNNPECEQTIGIRPGWKFDRLLDEPRQVMGGDRYDADHGRYFYARAGAFAAEQPARFAGCMAFKLRTLASGQELPETYDLYTARRYSPVLAGLLWRVGGFGFPFGVWLPLGLLGAFLLRRGPVLWVHLYVVTFALPLVLYWNSSRYRMPVVPALVILGSGALVWIARAWKRRQPARLGMAAASLLALGLPGALPYEHFSQRFDYEAEMLALSGMELVSQGNVEGGLERLSLAIEKNPQDADARNNRGSTLGLLGRLDEALTDFQEAVRLAPEYGAARQNVAAARRLLAELR